MCPHLLNQEAEGSCEKFAVTYTCSDPSTVGKHTNLEKADITIYTRVMAAGFFLRFGVKIGSAAITRRKSGIFFFRKSFRWYLPLLNYSTRLYWLWLFLAIAVARQLPARINGEALRISDDIVLEAVTKSWRLCFCLNGGAKNSAQLPCFATH